MGHATRHVPVTFHFRPCHHSTFLLRVSFDPFPLSRGPKQPQFKDANTWYSRRAKEGLFPHRLPSFRRGTTTCRRGRIDLHCCAHSSYPSPLRFTQSADHHCGWSIRARHLSGPCIASPRRSACDCRRDLVGSSNAKHDKHPGRTVQVRKTAYPSISSSSCAPPRSSHITFTVHKTA